MMGSRAEATKFVTARLFGFWLLMPTGRPWEGLSQGMASVFPPGLGAPGSEEQAFSVTTGMAPLLWRQLLHLVR